MSPDSPTEVIGSGFVLGIPGIYGNTTIPETPAPDADASSPSSAIPAEMPQTTDIIPTTEQPKRSAKTAKADKD